ncbi:MAG TPA: hypothetical protein VIN08_13400 [Ohtaekwangia sp.]|uniref:hypothetical protein n=1 Tax=Ohtaekwangia sp. TaxID=2066019 RepID=UPI002F952DC4
MKCYIHSGFIVLLFSTCISSRRTDRKDIIDIAACCQDTIAGRSKKEILNVFADVLNGLVPNYNRTYTKGFHVNNACRLEGVFICDFVDTLNVERTYNECIKFLDGHIYHFSAIENESSYSNIAIINGEDLKIFRALNCPGKGDKVEDVVRYVKNSMTGIISNEALIQRILNYRQYGIYVMEDPHAEFICK